MRIRKNSRLVSSSSTASFLVCQLNRSPWDIDSTTQGGSDICSFTRDGSMGDSSRYSGESMELSFEYMPPKREDNEDEIGSLDDGRVEYGSGFKHTTLYSDSATKKKTAPPVPPPVPEAAPKRRGRPRKVVESLAGTTTITATTITNQYEFYYYSGFGPRWGKKRGEDSPNHSSNNNNSSNNDSNNNSNNNSSNNDSDSGKKGGYIENVMDEELDYIESDDDDDGEEEGGVYGGRRVRKPIKARSLKSLM